MSYIGEFPPYTTVKGLYRFTGNSSDISGNSNNGTDTDIVYSRANGRFDQGAGFNGLTSLINLANPAILKLTGNFTLWSWIKPATDGSVIALWSWDGSKRAGIHLEVSGGGLKIESAKDTGNVQGTDYQIATGGTVIDGKWHLGLGTWDGTNLSVFVDGDLKAQTAWTDAPVYSAQNFYLGARYFTGTPNNFITASVDEVAIISEAFDEKMAKKFYAHAKGKYLL